MGDDDRAQQPRPRHAYPPASLLPSRETSGEIPVEVDPEVTPPPIVIDELGRPVSRARAPSPYPPTTRRERMTMQEVVEQLWGTRKVPDQVLEQLQRIVALEQRVADLAENGPAQVASEKVASLRVELIGADGDGGIVGFLASDVARDLAEHRKVVGAVEERATKADKFVRKVMYAAGSMILSAVIAAVVLIYQAGEHAASSKAETAAARAELVHKLDVQGESLTELREQVKLLLEARIHP